MTFKALLGICCLTTLPTVLCSFTVADYDSLRVAAPFDMPAIPIYHFPHQDFNIRNYGAKAQGEADDAACIAANTQAFRAAMAIDTDVLYQWKDLVPTYKDTATQIAHIFMRDVHCVRKYTYRSKNVEGLVVRDVTWNQLDTSAEE
jgi:hypothetical protein